MGLCDFIQDCISTHRKAILPHEAAASDIHRCDAITNGLLKSSRYSVSTKSVQRFHFNLLGDSSRWTDYPRHNCLSNHPVVGSMPDDPYLDGPSATCQEGSQFGQCNPNISGPAGQQILRVAIILPCCWPMRWVCSRVSVELTRVCSPELEGLRHYTATIAQSRLSKGRSVRSVRSQRLPHPLRARCLRLAK